MPAIFRDRAEAGQRLAIALRDYADRPDLTVLALPRGGVPVGFEVARALEAPLDVCVVRKLGVPGQPELAMGALASGGIEVLNHDVIRALGIPDRAVRVVAEREQRELERRLQAYRPPRPFPDMAGRTLILVDDGVATGSTMVAALRALRRARPAELVVAVPVAPEDSLDWLGRLADRVVCLATPEPFHAIGQWYDDFGQTSDAEVKELLQRAAEFHPEGTGAAG